MATGRGLYIRRSVHIVLRVLQLARTATVRLLLTFVVGVLGVLFATSADAALTARLRTVVRVAAWGVVVWVNLRALWAMSSIDFMGGGLPGGAGLLPGLNDSDVRDLVRELDL